VGGGEKSMNEGVKTEGGGERVESRSVRGRGSGWGLNERRREQGVSRQRGFTSEGEGGPPKREVLWGKA